MPRITAEELKARRRDFVEESGRAFDQMLGSDGQNGLVTFEQREERACDLGDGLTRRLLEEHLAADDGAEQFWNNGGLEAVLQVRAAYLSQDGRAEAFQQRRPRGPAVGRNRIKLRQPAG